MDPVLFLGNRGGWKIRILAIEIDFLSRPIVDLPKIAVNPGADLFSESSADEDEEEVDEKMEPDDQPAIYLANEFMSSNHFVHECIADARTAFNASTVAATGPAHTMWKLPGIPGTFMTHQMWGIKWARDSLLHSRGTQGIMIADEMGLGKTHTAIGTLGAMKLFLRQLDHLLKKKREETIEEKWAQLSEDEKREYGHKSYVGPRSPASDDCWDVLKRPSLIVVPAHLEN